MSESVQKCAYCGKEATDLHRDHVVPRSRGGPDDAFNIVMACQSCNFAKRDSMASEWLGERCPHSVLLIETRVNAKLKSVFKKRDYKGTGEPRPETKPTLFVITRDDDKKIAYIGEVLSESNGVISAVMVDELFPGTFNRHT